MNTKPPDPILEIEADAMPSEGKSRAVSFALLLAGYTIPIFLSLGIGAVVVAATGGDVVKAYAALLDGAFGSTYQASETLLRSIPLVFTGLAVAIAFRAGVWNIGAEGQLLVGAAAVAAVAALVPGWPMALLMPASFLAAGTAGAGWAWLAAFLKVRRNVPEVIATIMLNFLAINAVGALIRGPLQERAGAYPQSQPLPDAAVLLRFLPPTRIHLGLFVALLMAALVSVWMFRTVHGYRVRMTGLNPRASEAAGFGVSRVVTQAFLISGAVAGIGGAVELMGVTHILSDSFSPGWGYTAIAVALLGGLQPVGVVLAALLFGALDAGAAAMESQAGVSHVVVQVIQGVIIFTVAIRAAITYRQARET